MTNGMWEWEVKKPLDSSGSVEEREGEERM